MRMFLPGIVTLVVLVLASCSAVSSPVVVERTTKTIPGRQHVAVGLVGLR